MLGEITCANKVNGRVNERERDTERDGKNLIHCFGLSLLHISITILQTFVWLRGRLFK